MPTVGPSDPAVVLIVDLDLLAGSAPGADGVSFFPFLGGKSPCDGLGGSCGSLLGLGLSHDHCQPQRVVAERVALALRTLIGGCRASVDLKGGPLIVDGGGARGP